MSRNSRADVARSGVTSRGRPTCFQAVRAAARPAFVRSMSTSRSNCEKVAPKYGKYGGHQVWCCRWSATRYATSVSYPVRG